MLKRLIRNLRHKPKVVRDQVALVVALLFTATVTSVWMYNFPSKLYSLELTAEADKDAPGFTNIFSDFKDQFASLKEATSKSLLEEPTPTAEPTKPAVDAGVFTASGATATTPTKMGTTSVSGDSGEEVTGETAKPAPRPIKIVTVSSRPTTSTTTTQTP